MKSNENSTNTQQLQLSQLTTILLLGTVLLLFSSFENVFNTTTLSTLLDSLSDFPSSILCHLKRSLFEI